MQKHKKSKAKIPKTFISLKGFNGLKHASEFRRMTVTGPLTTNAAGLATFPVNVAYLRSNSTEWASYAARFTEYRLLKIRVHLTQSVYTGPGNANNTNFVIYTDRSGILAGATTSNAAYAYSGARAFNVPFTGHSPITYSDSAIDLEDQLYTAVGTSSVDFAVVIFYLNASQVSQTVMQFYIEFMVEFKGTQ
jgi:hypothetical protein